MEKIELINDDESARTHNSQRRIVNKQRGGGGSGGSGSSGADTNNDSHDHDVAAQRSHKQQQEPSGGAAEWRSSASATSAAGSGAAARRNRELRTESCVTTTRQLDANCHRRWVSIRAPFCCGLATSAPQRQDNAISPNGQRVGERHTKSRAKRLDFSLGANSNYVVVSLSRGHNSSSARRDIVHSLGAGARPQLALGRRSARLEAASTLMLLLLLALASASAATTPTLSTHPQRTPIAANGSAPIEASFPVGVGGGGHEEGRAGHWSLPNRPSLFSIIRFPNEECFDSSNQSGTCYTAFECKLLGGQPSSPCAAGFGSCCIVSRTCHVTTREKVVYFKNPSYPSADSDEKFCDLTVEMSDINVCQLRLDFLDFQLDPPTNGACKDDYMEISASGMPPQTVPRLCGLNRNQHLYITVPQDLSERSASIVFYTDPVGDHRWQLKVTQIDCNHYKPIDWKRNYAKFASSPLWNAHPNSGMKLPMHLMGKYSTTFASGFQTMSQTASALAYEFLKPQFTPRAPMGCLQYFTQPSGIIESFNFGQYLNNMDYSICIQRQPDTCRLVFTSSDYDWSLNGVGVSGSSSGVGDQDCARDYLLIPGASRTGDGFTYDRYCGGRLNYYRGQALSAPVVIKTAGPIVLRFHSDGQYEGLNNGGFRLQYEQSAQDCIYHSAEEAGALASQQLLASTLADSRPLSQQLGALVQESPVMYASQQLATTTQHPLPLPAAHNWLLAGGSSGANESAAQLADSQEPQTMSKRIDLATGGARQLRGHLLLADLSKAFQLITSPVGLKR